MMTYESNVPTVHGVDRIVVDRRRFGGDVFNEWHWARYHGEPVTQTVIDRWRCQRADYDAIISRAIARETREHDGDMTLVRPS